MDACHFSYQGPARVSDCPKRRFIGMPQLVRRPTNGQRRGGMHCHGAELTWLRNKRIADSRRDLRTRRRLTVKPCKQRRSGSLGKASERQALDGCDARSTVTTPLRQRPPDRQASEMARDNDRDRRQQVVALDGAHDSTQPG
ncbi:hypothetical protein GCM10027572_08460 [Flexivirga lutea]